MLLDSLAKIGIEKDKVTFVNLSTLVQGPKYKGDYLENKTMYEKYQQDLDPDHIYVEHEKS